MSDDIYSEVLEAARQNWWEVYSGVVPFREESILDWLSEDRAQERLQRISSRLGQDLGGLAMLEVGSGFGAFVRASQRRGISCYGIDPDPTACRASVRWISAGSGKSSIVRAVGERLPFSSETFDIVASFQVLEHTEDPAKVLRESIRVLREGGVLHFVVPNYKSFWEGHYGLYWPPLLPKPLAKLYVRLRGRTPAFLDTIHYVTPKTIRDSLSGQNVKILSLGAEIWQKRLQSLQFPTWGRAERLLPLVRLVHRLRIVRLVTYLGIRFELYFPIVLTARKVSSQPPCLTIQDRERAPGGPNKGIHQLERSRWTEPNQGEAAEGSRKARRWDRHHGNRSRSSQSQCIRVRGALPDGRVGRGAGIPFSLLRPTRWQLQPWETS